jgi:catechol 2,3-dioxygenase-like lactoylglutathione lyase family enzyme
MITKLNVTSIYVLDKDEALEFYVNKLGLEKGNDVRQGSYRWLTVRVPGNGGTEISLEQPGPPLHDEATAELLRELITKGALSGLVLNTDDARGLYETLKARGVTDFTQEPTDHFYGTDMGLRDPFGNAIRIVQQGTDPQETTACPCRRWSHPTVAYPGPATISLTGHQGLTEIGASGRKGRKDEALVQAAAYLVSLSQ